MFVRKNRKEKPVRAKSSRNSGRVAIQPEYDNPHVVSTTRPGLFLDSTFSTIFIAEIVVTKSRSDPPRNRFDLTDESLTALFGVREPSPNPDDFGQTEGSLAAEMMHKLDNIKIKNRLDFDQASQSSQNVSEMDRTTCCTLHSFVSDDTISREEIAPMMMTPSSKPGFPNIDSVR